MNAPHPSPGMPPDLAREIHAMRADIAQLAQAFHVLQGNRLTRAQVCERLNVCSHTLTRLIRRRGFPQDVAGMFLLADVIAWERAPR